MSRKHTRPLLALLVLILTSLACGPQKEIVKDGQVTCKLAFYFKGFVYQCYCPIDGSSTASAQYTTKELQDADVTSVKDRACINYYMSHASQENPLQSTATPTAVPSSTPTKRPTATPAPYLSGEVTNCNLTDRYINFSIDPNAIDPSGLDFEVTIGGLPSTCSVPSSNPSILSCTFPQGQTFPAQIIVNVDGSTVNDFSYDGAACVVPNNNNNNNQPDPNPQPNVVPPPDGGGG
ncbi:MAG: hypothetical protein U0Z26_18555 [Anaerolineales bacterium]